MTAGEPLFCGTCGRTYDVKLCPRLHVNPRSAEVCSKCGSRELSTPQPRIPMSLRLLALMIRLGLGLLLFYASLCLLIAILRTREVQQALVAFGLLLAGLWWLWSKLPDWFREALRSFWKSRRHNDDD
jgi:ribosomal protein L40E